MVLEIHSRSETRRAADSSEKVESYTATSFTNLNRIHRATNLKQVPAQLLVP